MIKFVIEHLDKQLTRWAMLEYAHVSKLVGSRNLWITGLKNPEWISKLAGMGSIGFLSKFSILEYIQLGLISASELLILDPSAPLRLKPPDLAGIRFLVIGGIMGSHPPLGRTKQLLSSKIPGAKKRNLGPYQFCVDGAAYLALQIYKGCYLNQIPIQYGLELELDPGHWVRLPYGFPVVDGKPLLAPGLLEYLRSQIQFEDLAWIKLA